MGSSTALWNAVTDARTALLQQGSRRHSPPCNASVGLPPLLIPLVSGTPWPHMGLASHSGRRLGGFAGAADLNMIVYWLPDSESVGHAALVQTQLSMGRT